jgi:hypothetical protein
MDKCLVVLGMSTGHSGPSTDGHHEVNQMACGFKKNTFCPMGEHWPCRTADCPPIMSRSNYQKHDPFSREFVVELKKKEKEK